MTQPLKKALVSAPAEPSYDLLRETFRRALTPMLITDPHGLICFANGAFEQATGHLEVDLVGKRPNLVKSDLQSPDFYRLMWEGLHRDGRWQGEIWNRNRNGQVFREWLSICALPDASGRAAHYLGSYSGLSSPHVAAAHGDDLGGVDVVTGVLNRRTFLAGADRLHQAHGTVAVIALDISHFTEINEHYGLRVGDSILRQMALRCVRGITVQGGRSVLGRVGSDEFAVAWVPDRGSELTEADQIQRASESVRQAVCGDYEVECGRTIQIEVTVGVSLMSSGLHNAADSLLHASTARQTSTHSLVQIHHYEALATHRQLVRALREDLLAGQLDVAYQPKVDLRNGRLTGMEALARWTGPDGIAVPPSVFIPLAERNGLIADLGDRVLERVLRQLAGWRDEGLPVVPVAVNFSAPQFQRHDMAERLQAALKRHRIPASLIEIELTESILLNDFEVALVTLNKLREVGVGLSIDDFGTGYSSLAYLRRFKVDALKLDHSFVSDLVSDPRTREIIDTVIALAHKLEMNCIAEGVENMDQCKELQKLGCDQAQGYLFARPMSAQSLRSYLVDGSVLTEPGKTS